MAIIRRITGGETGSEAAQLLYDNDNDLNNELLLNAEKVRAADDKASYLVDSNTPIATYGTCNWKIGYFLDASGSEYRSNDYQYTKNYISVQGKTPYTLLCGGLAVIWYDINLNVVGYSGNAGDDVRVRTYYAPAKAAYCRVNQAVGSVQAFEMYEGVNLRTYSVRKKVIDILDLLGVELAGAEILADYSSCTWITGYYLGPNDAANASVDFSYTENFIPVEGATKYTLQTAGYAVCWYDENKTLIGDYGDPSDPLEIRTVTSPANARYMRVNQPNTNIADFIIWVGEHVGHTEIPDLKIYNTQIIGSGTIGDTKDCYVTFPDQDTRTNIASGEKHSVLFGKIKRWFSDLKNIAFTGSAADLIQDANSRLVTDSEKAGWNDKYTRAEVDSKDAAGLQAAKEYAAQKIAEIVDSAPETLNTLNELAAALGNDPNFATSIMALIGGKADLVHTHTKAQITDFPDSIPANGGNADTVGGFGIDDLGKIINTAIADIDNMPGFFSGFWNEATSGTKPGSYGTVLQVANKYGLPNSGKEVWVFQIAHAHGVDRPYWRRQFNNGGWSTWKQVALMEDIPSAGAIRFDQVLDAQQVVVEPDTITRRVIECVFKAGQGYISRAAIGLVNKSTKFSPVVISAGVSDDGTEWADWIFDPDTGEIIAPGNRPFAFDGEVIKNSGEQTLSNGRFNMLVSAPEHVIMFKDANGNIGYIGFGGYPKKDIHIYNYESGKFVNIAADGKLYYDQKELAFKGDVGGETLMLDTRDTPEAVQNNIAVYKATNIYLSTYAEIPRIGISIPEEMGFTGGQRLWAIGAAQLSGAALVFTFSGLDSSDMVQYFKAVLTNTGLLTVTSVPH